MSSPDGNGIVGTWEVALNAPTGEQVVTLEFVDEHSGAARLGPDSVSLSDVTVTGHSATFRVALSKPIGVSVNCSIQFDGNSMTGTAKAGIFASFALVGRRLAH